MKTTVVENGRAALFALQVAGDAELPFDLILLDVIMPDMNGFAVLEHVHSMPVIDRPTILMLSSLDQRGDIARARELGAAAYLVKPIRPAELHDAILAALSPATQPVPLQRVVVPVRPIKEPGRRLRILVTEDNQVNQILTARILQNAGYSATVANNGKDALEILSHETFDLLLMDVQMPIMDGLQATARIRLQEQDTGKHMPIIAITAHALKGDRERCLAAGMDSYVSKPFRNSELISAIVEALGPPVQQDVNSLNEQTANSPA